MQNVNISETEKIKLVWTHQEKRRQPLKKNDGQDCTWEDKKGRPRRRWLDNTREDMEKYEMTTDMTENRQYWKMMVKTGLAHKDVEMVYKGEGGNMSTRGARAVNVPP